MSFGNLAVASPAVREGKLRGLAVTSAKRSPVLPDLPTLDEAGVWGFEATSWGGLFAPAKSPAAIVRKLHLEIVKALAQPDMRAKIPGKRCQEPF
jgi:tripartite-type tricarboxylate transporter receptor subunit TctC